MIRDVAGDGRQRPDLRLVPIALALWAGVLAGLSLPLERAAVAWVLLGGCMSLVAWRLGRAGRLIAAISLACVAVGIVAGASRATPVRDGPVAQLAEEKAHVEVEGVIAGDARRPRSEPTTGTAGDDPERVLIRMRIDQISGRGTTIDVRTAVFLAARGAPWTDLLPGQRLRARGRLSPANGDVAAFLQVDGEPELVGGPGFVARMTEPMRSGLREAVDAVPAPHRGLIPGMVVGDESLMSDDLRDDMRVTGLTHLTAVSGTHVSIVLLSVLGAARLAGVRGYGLPVVGVLSVAGFVVLVRPDPSVLRASVMGTIAVAGILAAGRRRTFRALAAAVCVLVLVDPWLARSVGFALSVSATAGILVLVPTWQRSMSRLPRPLALALAVPLAAQVACTPLLVTAFGQFSVASVPANMLVAPVVAPAMVLGVAATVASAAIPGVASMLAWLSGLPAWWIVTVARWFAGHPGAEVEWPDGAAGTLAGILAAGVAVALIPLVLRTPVACVAVAGIVAIALLRPFPGPGWPPAGWVVAGCEVGQGDGFAIRAGPGSAVVIDAGPDSRLIQRCLDSLGIVHVPLLVLTHYHADHVAGVPGVLSGREVDRVLVSPLDEPVAQADQVVRWMDEADVPIQVARAGERYEIGDRLVTEVLWPRRIIRSSSESDANNASVVLAIRADEVALLFTGDIEPLAQRALRAAEPNLRADVLKVAHHGSQFQDERMLADLGMDLALVGVGENRHGHPSGETMALLEGAGVEVRRTDEDGTFAVVRTGGGLGVVSR
ncbi:ComEC/Rec2 family competence protein [Actinobacteria bacterium YIM 96077]|uniref:ComEC/Rec2 family competence protein n=1 Tax=Phytoactinopolyspora halophila TaxID=1981511 RepID=A0A329QF62_9ACTN|nr:ComEC/Rec2 family competence protein [Phytoactinopolyspora halophila]AYY14100.1 ComEC/Rec2 family competence protein [Actinobacteria bacterium YIM 96077]RAW11007.1 ComEC/Rec2 family competence protein [Phytoactinopolyspora halophila]